MRTNEIAKIGGCSLIHNLTVRRMIVLGFKQNFTDYLKNEGCKEITMTPSFEGYETKLIAYDRKMTVGHFNVNTHHLQHHYPNSTDS